MSTQLFLTYSDGSEAGIDSPEYGIAYESEPGIWTWSEGLDTADRTEALRIVAERGYTATAITGGWYGDDRDDSHRLTPA